MTLSEAKRARQELLSRAVNLSKLGDATATELWKKKLKEFTTAKSLAAIEEGLHYFKGYFK